MNRRIFCAMGPASCVVFAIPAFGGLHARLGGGLPLRAGVIDVEPWGWAKSNELCGVYAEWLVQFGHHLGRVVQLNLMPLVRVQADLKSGHLDLALMTERPFQNAHSLGRVAELDFVVLGDTDNGGTIGVVRGVVLPDQFQHPKWRRVELSSVRSQLEMLRLGRLNAVIGVRQSLITTAEALGATALLANARSVEKRSANVWIGAHLHDTAAESDLRKAFAEMNSLRNPAQFLEWPSCRPNNQLSSMVLSAGRHC